MDKQTDWTIVDDVGALPKKSPVWFGHVYALEYGDCIKIGHTTHLRKRSRALKSSAFNYSDVVIGRIAFTQACTNHAEIEQYLHKEFGSYRVNNGELFRLSLDEFLSRVPPLQFLDESGTMETRASVTFDIFKGGFTNGWHTVATSINGVSQEVPLDSDTDIASKLADYDALMQCESVISIGLCVKHFSNVPWKAVFPYLRAQGYLNQSDLPTQKAIDEDVLAFVSRMDEDETYLQAAVKIRQLEKWLLSVMPSLIVWAAEHPECDDNKCSDEACWQGMPPEDSDWVKVTYVNNPDDGCPEYYPDIITD